MDGHLTGEIKIVVGDSDGCLLTLRVVEHLLMAPVSWASFSLCKEIASDSRDLVRSPQCRQHLLPRRALALRFATGSASVA